MTDDALLSTPARQSLFDPEATGHYGAGYGDPGRHFGTGGPAYHDEHHHHYQQFRREHERQLDEDYAAWRQHRFGREFGQWRSGRSSGEAPPQEGPLKSLGRAISETVTGSQAPAHAGGDGSRTDPDRFFERS